MVVQYPYILQVKQYGTATKNPDGSYTTGAATWVNLARCRDENGNGKKVTVEDGSVREYSYLVQMPMGVEALKAGTEIQVMDGSTVRSAGKVLYSRKGQLHTQAWV